MAILKKTLPFTNNRIVNRYWLTGLQANKLWYYRSSGVVLVMGGLRLFVHKGIYFKPTRVNLFDLSIKLGTFVINRKPLAHPIKRVKKKKRFGKIEYDWN